jgi:hypothetical protein
MSTRHLFHYYRLMNRDPNPLSCVGTREICQALLLKFNIRGVTLDLDSVYEERDTVMNVDGCWCT